MVCSARRTAPEDGREVEDGRGANGTRTCFEWGGNQSARSDGLADSLLRFGSHLGVYGEVLMPLQTPPSDGSYFFVISFLFFKSFSLFW